MKNVLSLILLLTALTITTRTHAATGPNGSVVIINPSADSVACLLQLPDMVSDFAAVRNNDFIILSWVTQNRSDSADFIVEKSIDGKNWKTCSNIATHGESSSPAVYFYGDAHPSANNYYRLKQTAAGSAVVYSYTVKAAPSTKHTKKK